MLINTTTQLASTLAYSMYCNMLLKSQGIMLQSMQHIVTAIAVINLHYIHDLLVKCKNKCRGKQENKTDYGKKKVL